jgi:hypothetical protein
MSLEGFSEHQRAIFNALSPEMQAQLLEEKQRSVENPSFVPNPGVQAAAFSHPAALMLYGGQGGGGKTGLLCGLALTQHTRSLIMRRQYTDLGDIIEDVLEFNGTRKGFNGSIPPTLKTNDGRRIVFGACAKLGDEQSFMGRARDFLGVDEAAHFLETQVRVLMGWVRSSKEGQHCRTVLATNPPTTALGQWLVPMFSPWLDITSENPAKPGEIRYFVTDPDGKDYEVPGPEPYQFPGVTEPAIPKSRTFMPASVDDNPFIGSEYKAELDALPEPYRSAVRDGNFMAVTEDGAYQLIPSSWVRDALDRWEEKPPKDMQMSCIACDIAQGGKDETVVSRRYAWWFAPLIKVPGRDTPTGVDISTLVFKHRRGDAQVVLDMGGGYGGGAYDHLKANGVPVTPFKGANKSKNHSQDGQLAFVNKRSEAWWRFREALDPSQEGGSPISLPSDPALVADLTAPTFEIGPRGIKVQTKEEVIKLLGRSTDCGDAVVMALYGQSKSQKQLPAETNSSMKRLRR